MNNTEEANAKTFVELVNSGRMIQSEKFGTWFSSTDKQSGKQLIEDLKIRFDKVKQHYFLMQQYLEVLTEEDIDSVINDLKIEKLFKGIKDPVVRAKLIEDYKNATVEN